MLIVVVIRLLFSIVWKMTLEVDRSSVKQVAIISLLQAVQYIKFYEIASSLLRSFLAMTNWCVWNYNDQIDPQLSMRILKSGEAILDLRKWRKKWLLTKSLKITFIEL